MSDEIWKRDEPDSPCIKLCVMDPASGFCLGCFRTTSEIAQWADFSPEQRTKLRQSLLLRGSSLKPTRRLRNTRSRNRHIQS